jgi:hypothetical protein
MRVEESRGYAARERNHFVDHGERGAEVYYDFYYAYWEYEIEFGEQRYGVRVYDDEEAAFVVTARSPHRTDRNPEELAAVLDILRAGGGQRDPHARWRRRLRASGVAGQTP